MATASALVVVDTDVASFSFKQDTRDALYEPHLRGRVLIISPQTLAEVERWALVRNWGARRREQMEEHLRRYILAPFDRAVCLKWAEAMTSARRVGLPISVADAWVAAVALANELPLVTHNRAHFVGVAGLTIISEA